MGPGLGLMRAIEITPNVNSVNPGKLSSLNGNVLEGPSWWLSHTPRPFSSSPYRRADPWVLPHTPEHLASTTLEDVVPTPLPRPNESVDTLRARLVYQSRKRGTLESDLLLSTFARDNLSIMSETEMREYDRVSMGMPSASFSHETMKHATDASGCGWIQLLDEADWDIYYWATGKRTPPERWTDSEILRRLAVHAKNEGKVVRLMPAL
ncbi:hypothetical protein D9615_008313 [Tricholomella constricta]|uniref:Succinate dehydrogenase assembly factor 2, mitochondrial n=1 Tax=Tricholomella constricta TaxID=117010 RepID=A0A8H5M4W4_9AGAR|nr:hypothetical protein D9615_008313 [Tricholomella constricta]